MTRPTNRVGQQPILWHLLLLRLRKCLKLRYLLFIFILLLLSTYLRIANNAPPTDQSIYNNELKSAPELDIKVRNYPRSTKCDFNDTESILRYIPFNNTNLTNDTRPKPSIERLKKLFQILISHEEKYRKVFDYLNIFRFTDIYNTLHAFANHTQRLENIYCLFQRYITISDNGHIDITPEFIIYLKQISNYLSDGFKIQHLSWNQTSQIEKPVIILAANAHFYDTLQASMRTVNKYLEKFTVAIYDLGFNSNQLEMIKENCIRCIIIPFPFAEIEPVAGHIRNLGNFAWKPIIVQDAVRRFGSIIYGDTSIRYQTSNFDHLLNDNLIRGFSCRELPGHYLPCFTLSGTFSWFNETYSAFDDVYIAEAGFVAVTDNFLSRLILKTWVTCALDSSCIVPQDSPTRCRRTATGSQKIHRYDQSAMVTVLSFYFFPSPRQNDKSDPAPYDMFASIQARIAEVRRFEGDKSYFTHQIKAETRQNSLTTTITTVKKQ